MFALVCATLCQGLVVSAGDLYETREGAEAELKDLECLRVGEGIDDGPGESGYEVIELHGSRETGFTDEAGVPVQVMSEES